MKILIVDDSRVMRRIVIRTLRPAGLDGHELIEAGNGREGLDAVAQHAPDPVLSDWNMPVMTGIELLHALRGNGQEVPFGFTASEGTPEMVTAAEQGGALFVMTEPFTPESVREKLDPVLV